MNVVHRRDLYSLLSFIKSKIQKILSTSVPSSVPRPSWFGYYRRYKYLKYLHPTHPRSNPLVSLTTQKVTLKQTTLVYVENSFFLQCLLFLGPFTSGTLTCLRSTLENRRCLTSNLPTLHSVVTLKYQLQVEDDQKSISGWGRLRRRGCQKFKL